MPLAQAGIGLAGAVLLALVLDRGAALGFLAGAAAIALGQAVYAWRTALRTPVVPAGRALSRLLMGSLLKWLVIGAGLVLAMTAAGLPARYVMAGALAACLAYLICLPWLLR